MTSKSVFISAIFLIVFSSLKAQPKDDSYSVDVKGKLDLGATISLGKISSVKLYKFDPKNHCNHSKALRIVYEDSISKCFDFVRNIGKVSGKKIIALLNLKSTFGNENYACFDTNYALIVYDIYECIIGYIHLGLNCNKAWIFPTTSALNFIKIRNLCLLVFQHLPGNNCLDCLKLVNKFRKKLSIFKQILFLAQRICTPKILTESS